MNEKVETKQYKRHMKWLKETCPQTYNSLQIAEGDSEDIKSCCQRLEQELYSIKRQLAEAKEENDTLINKNILLAEGNSILMQQLKEKQK